MLIVHGGCNVNYGFAIMDNITMIVLPLACGKLSPFGLTWAADVSGQTLIQIQEVPQ